MKVYILGNGNMGSALEKGLSKCLQFETKLLGKNSTLSNKKCTHQDVIILCVKPQNLTKTLTQWLNEFEYEGDEKPLIISILAGTSLEKISTVIENLGFQKQNWPVVRAMPNLAANIGESATAFALNDHSSLKHAEVSEAIFNSIGKCWRVDEEQLDTVTGLSGSGPAYVCLMIEALADGGVKMGLSRKLAQELATQTLLGTAKLLQVTKTHPAILREQVTTPAGTTISAIHELERHGIRAMLISAVCTASERSKELSQSV